MHMQDDHIVKPQLLPLEQEFPDQIRLGQVIRENKVRQLLLENALLDPFCVKGGPGCHQGNLRADHIEAVKCKNDLRAGRAQDAYPGILFLRHIQCGKD